MRELTFIHPWFLLGLLALPWFAWWLGRPGPLPSVPVPSLRGVAALRRIPRRHSGRPRWFLLILALALGLIGLARPRIPQGNLPDPSKGIDIMLLLDFSRSMAEIGRAHV